MHDTLIKEVKLSIDSISNEAEGSVITGWCGSTVVNIENVGITDNREVFPATYGKRREDVSSFYKDNKYLNTGFSIYVPQKFKKEDDIFLQILKEEKWETISQVTDSNKVRLTEKQNSNFKFSNSLDLRAIVVDNFYENPDEIRNFALSCDFAPHLKYHKGQRTEVQHVPEGIKDIFEALLHKKITNWENHSANGVFQFCVAEDKLVYHTDSQSYAAVVFLTPDAPPSCGTTFFKSKKNNLRKEPSKTEAEKIGKGESQIMFDIFNNNFYDKTNLEVVDVIGNVYNRLVIWDAKLIHAASEYFGDRKENSRLFHMFFFDAE